jgi:D-proline reductase (dithiol) PrdB
VGLIARIIEAAGIPTVSISLARDLTAAVGVPRAIFLKWPLGHPLGEPERPLQQQNVIHLALCTLLTAAEPGVIVEPGWRWRREEYTPPNWEELATLNRRDDSATSRGADSS